MAKEILGIATNRRHTNMKYVKDVLGISTANAILFSEYTSAVDDAYNALTGQIDGILSGETHNTLNNEVYNESDKATLKLNHLALTLDYQGLFNHSELTAAQKLTLLKFASLQNMYAYYPEAIAKIVGPDLGKFIAG